MSDFSKDQPAGQSSISIGDDSIRTNQNALEERLALEHSFPDNPFNPATSGRHTFGVGTATERLATFPTPKTGNCWFNTDTDGWEIFNGTGWADSGGRQVGQTMSMVFDVATLDLYDFPPKGWIPQDGRQLDKTIYSRLFNVIQYTFGGAGNLYNVPNRGGKVSMGYVQGGDGDGDYGAISAAGEITGVKKVSYDPGTTVDDHPATLTGTAHSGSINVDGNPQVSVPNSGHRHTLPILAHTVNETAMVDQEVRQPTIVEGYFIYAGQ